MGFIERLRREREARDAIKHAAAERERLKREHTSMLEEQLHRREEEERKRHEERKLQARQFQRESGIISLAEEMEQLIEGGYGWKSKPDYQLSDRDSTALLIRLVWHSNYSHKVRGEYYNFPQEVSGSGKYFVIETTPDGIILFHADWLGLSSIPRERWQDNKEVLESALEKAYNHPKIHSWRYRPSGGGYDYSGGDNRGPCLSSYALISTPTGLVPIKNLKVGDYVWTVDKVGNRVVMVITMTTRTPVKDNHKMLHIILSDGREIFVSAYHPTITGKPVICLNRGQFFDGSLVSSINLIPYKGKYTYDILPVGDTGGYWANNILMGSTLFNKFEPFVIGNTSSATEIAFDMHTYAFFRPRI